jgi:hypothetical protein
MDGLGGFLEGALAVVLLLRGSFSGRRGLPLRRAEAGGEASSERFHDRRFPSSRGNIYIFFVSNCPCCV